MNRKQLFLLQMASLFCSALTLSYVLTGRLIGVVSALALLVIVPLSVWGWRRIDAAEQDMPPEQRKIMVERLWHFCRDAAAVDYLDRTGQIKLATPTMT
jgi:hypothetical protein